MLKLLRIAAVAAAAFVCHARASAEMVGDFWVRLDDNSKTIIVVELSDLRRPGIFAANKKSPCELTGDRMVFIEAIYPESAPRSTPYGSGCWHYSEGRVYVTWKAIRGNQGGAVTIDAKDFKTTKSFQGWDSYPQLAVQ